MVRIYANLIESGARTIAQVPERIRQQVKEVLIDDGYPELAEE